MKDMPGLTTNDEFGFWKASGKVVFGTPPEAFRVSYQKHYAKKLGFASHQTQRETLSEAVSRIGAGAVREKGETWVPLHVWSTPNFQTWYSALRTAGHELHRATVVWTFHGGHSRAVFFWALHVDVLIAGENRHKTNEVVISRPDVCSVLLFRRRGTNIADAQVVLVREFRSACSNSRGFVYELPGGSSWKNDSGPLGTALEEMEEEVGLHLPSQRFTQHTTRQFVATMSAHSGHLFSAELTEEELDRLVHLQKAGTALGVLEDTERTYIEVRTVGEILSGGYVDWSTLGMILSILHA
jgi:8-oxo-dGTP pyrophosphatase MutT (NUDIX family)